MNRISFLSRKEVSWIIIIIVTLFLIFSLSNCGGGGSGNSKTSNGDGDFSNSATITWEAPTTNADGTPLTCLGGYKIYYGSSSDGDNYMFSLDVGNVTTYKFENLSPSTYYLAVTAYDTSANENGYIN